jgi:hypothetical protein
MAGLCWHLVPKPVAGPVTHWTKLGAFRAGQGETRRKRVQSVPRLPLQGAQTRHRQLGLQSRGMRKAISPAWRCDTNPPPPQRRTTDDLRTGGRNEQRRSP